MIYYNGEFIKTIPTIAYNDCGFTTGIGIFDSMLVKDKTPVHITEHFERIIYDSQTVIGLKPFFNLEKFTDICNKLITDNNFHEPYLRIRTTITGGSVKAPLQKAHTPTVLIEVKPAMNPDNIEPARAVIVKDFPRIANCILENCKRLDYTRSYAARRKAEALGADEALLTNTDGNIACGTTSNIFIEENGALITPPLSEGILAGITRRKIIEEREVKQETISINRLKQADKIYLTNSFIGLRDVTLIQ